MGQVKGVGNRAFYFNNKKKGKKCSFQSLDQRIEVTNRSSRKMRRRRKYHRRREERRSKKRSQKREKIEKKKKEKKIEDQRSLKKDKKGRTLPGDINCNQFVS